MNQPVFLVITISVSSKNCNPFCDISCHFFFFKFSFTFQPYLCLFFQGYTGFSIIYVINLLVFLSKISAFGVIVGKYFSIL